MIVSLRLLKNRSKDRSGGWGARRSSRVKRGQKGSKEFKFGQVRSSGSGERLGETFSE